MTTALGDVPGPGIYLILDASVAIDFIDIHNVPLFGQLNGHRFGIPRVVVGQILEAKRRRDQLLRAIESDIIDVIDDPIPFELLQVFATTEQRLGKADATVLVYAIHRNGGIATDDRRLRAEATRHSVGPLHGTADILSLAIARQRISLAQGNRKMRHLGPRSQHACLCQLCGEICSCQGTLS